MMKAGYKLRSVWFQGLAALGTARPPPWRHEAGLKGLFPALWLVSPKGPRNQTSFPRHLMHRQGCFFLLGPWNARGPRELMLFSDWKNYGSTALWWPPNYFFFFPGETTIQTPQSCPPPKQLGKRGLSSPTFHPPARRCQKTLTWTAFCGVFASPPPPLSVISASAFSRGLYVFRQHSSLFPNVSQF